MVKLVIPVERFEEGNSLIFPHFGRAPQFVVVELLSNGAVKSTAPVDNAGEHFGGHIGAEMIVSDLEPDAIVVKGMGPRALEAFQNRGMQVLTGNVNTVREAIDAYVSGGLMGMTETCKEHHHNQHSRH